jgi:hypothetical protein
MRYPNMIIRGSRIAARFVAVGAVEVQRDIEWIGAAVGGSPRIALTDLGYEAAT